MNKAYKFKLRKLTDEQKTYFAKCFGCTRVVYNWALKRQEETYEASKQNGGKKHLTPFDLYGELKELRNEKEYLKEVDRDTLRGAIDALDNAFQKFFKKQAKYPKKKDKYKSKKSSQIGIRRVDFEKWQVKLAKVGWVKICKNKTFDVNEYKITNCTISLDACGDYWVSIAVKDNKEKPQKTEIKESTSVGIDVGLKTYAVLSDGTEFKNPKWYDKSSRLLKIRQRKFSRTEKGSKRHERARLQLNKIYRKITNQRIDYICKLVSKLTEQYDTICIEDLNIKGILKNHKLARATASAAWGMFFGKLVAKGDERGKNVLHCGRYDATSQTCSCCGHKHNLVKDLDVRHWTCPECGAEHDRDLNAAINIMEFALNKAKCA